MADIIARLQVDSSQYDGKLKTAIDQMTKMEQEVRRTGATFEFADKAELEFVKSLGQMGTASSSASSKLGELTKAFMDLSVLYQSMTEDERKSAFGKGLSESIEQVKARIGELKTSMGDAQFELKIDGGGLNTSIEQLGRLTEEVRSSGGSFENASKEQVDFIRSIGDLSAQSASARTKMMEYTNAIATLTSTYREMSDAEKNSDTGRALSESIDKLKAKAAQLKDIMSDTNVELTNLASDTAFTDGVGLMTRTVGSCAAAITAWNGDGKEMEEVVKELAKIGATVAAVDSLTKAFQKQNLVLLKNPYVAATAAVVALGVAIGKLIQKSQELDGVQKTLNDVQAKGRDNSAKEMAQIDTLNSILHDNTRSLEDRKAALSEIQALVPNYHGALTEEGSLINDNTGAIDDYIDSLQRAALAQAAFDKMVELQKKKMQQQVELQEKQKELQVAQARNERAQGEVVYAGTEMTQVYTQMDTSSAERAVQQAEADIRATNAEIDALRNLVKATDVSTATTTAATTGKGGKTTASTYKTSKSSGFTLNSPYGMPDTGTLADLEQQAAMVQNSMSGATNAQEYQEMETYLNTILAKIQEIKGVKEQTFTPGSLNDLNQQLKEAQETLANCAPFTEEWANALADVAAKQAAVNSLQEQINGTSESGVDNAKSTGQAWQNAVAAVNNVGSALQQIEDPAAKVSGIVMQAVANIALGFAQAAASPATGAAGVFGWIAAATAGVATMVATIASIKSVTKGYASGGMVEGTSYSGDNIVARLNAGEGVLTQTGVQTAAAMADGMAGPQRVVVEGRISGKDILLSANNTNRAAGGSRGFYTQVK